MADVLIKQLIQKVGGLTKLIYPKTHEKAVVMTDGTRLDAALAEINRRLDALEKGGAVRQGEIDSLRVSGTARQNEIDANTRGIASNLASIIALEKGKWTIPSDDTFTIDENGDLYVTTDSDTNNYKIENGELTYTEE